MPPTRTKRVKSRATPYTKSRGLVNNLTTYLRETELDKNFKKYIKNLSTSRGKGAMITELLKEVIEFITFHKSAKTNTSKLHHLESVNDHVSLYVPEFEQYVVDDDGGASLIYSMAIPYYEHIISVLIELSEEGGFNFDTLIDKIQVEIDYMFHRLQNPPRKLDEFDDIINSMSTMSLKKK